VWVHSYPFLEDVPGKPLQPRVIVFAGVVDEDVGDVLKTAERGRIRSRTFDLVLNGEEIASGYIGNHSLEFQRRVWGALFLVGRPDLYRLRAPIESHRFGVPPHGGMNLGFDRLVALMLGLDAIDEVMHFPKDARCRDTLLGAPAKVDPDVVADLVVEVKAPAEMTLENMNQEVLTS
jgi:aspartyl-tRNA synthetase